MAQALRFQGNLPIKFWGECILTATYLINRTHSTVLNGKTPYEMLYEQQPAYEHLKIFGSLCYAHNQRRNGNKFASRSKKYVFIDYPYGKKGWKLFDLETKEIFVSRDVEFVETKYSFSINVTTKKDDPPKNWSCEEIVGDVTDGVEETDHTGGTEESGDMTMDDRRGEPNAEFDEQGVNLQNMDTQDTMLPSISPIEPLLGKGHRTKQPSTSLQDYVTNTTKRLSPSNYLPSPKADSGAPYPITDYVNYDNFYLAHRVFLHSFHRKRSLSLILTQ